MRRWIVLLAVSLAWSTMARAAGPDDQYLEIYNEILHADSAAQGGMAKDAAVQYSDARRALEKFKAEYPTWNPEVVSFRTEYVAEQLQKLAQYLPAAAPSAAAPVATPPPAAAPSSPAQNAETAEVAALRQQVQALVAANTDLENRLKEALSVQPAAVSPVELRKAQQRIIELEKEQDLLKLALEQAKAGAPAVPSAVPTDEAAKKWKRELAAREKEWASLEKHYKKQLAAAYDAIADAQKDRLYLQQELKAAQEKPNASAPNEELEQLRAKVAALEAQPSPYTEEELAVMKSAQQPTAAALPAPVKRVGHSKEELPLGTGALMAEATRSIMERDFAGAEAKLKDILRQDENNVYVLAYLGNAQLAEGHLDDCEKTVDRALKLDPDDPASLYLLGVVRFEQNRYDAALNALSRSAQLNPTNSSTQNYLGCVLAEKGQRTAAEAALRKALVIDPDNADANYNLAFIYATEKPPSPQLATWHYQRALALGHPKSASLEKLLPDR